VRGLGRRLFDFYWGTGIADDVPALTYYLVLSLAPFALGLAALEALLLKGNDAALRVADQLNRFLPEEIHPDIVRLVLNTRDNSTLLLALAIVAMLWTTSGAIGVLERCESRILACPRHDVVTGRLRNIGLGAVVALMVVAASATAPVIGNAADTLDLRGHFPGGLLLAFNVLGSVLAFSVIYRYAPRSRVGWRSAGVGAVPAAIAIQFVPALVGLYVGAAAGYAAVRLFLLLAVVLFGLYAIALVMLVGAGLAVRRELRARGEPLVRPPAPGSPEHFAAELRRIRKETTGV
jgi:YihY family inner membrane protein